MAYPYGGIDWAHIQQGRGHQDVSDEDNLFADVRKERRRRRTRKERHMIAKPFPQWECPRCLKRNPMSRATCRECGLGQSYATVHLDAFQKDAARAAPVKASLAKTCKGCGCAHVVDGSEQS